MGKEKSEGLNLQISAVFARLDAIRDALPEDCLVKYKQLIEQEKQSMKEKYDVNEKQLEEWLQ